MTLRICATCAVEDADRDEPLPVCPICADERQYVPPGGQVWTTLEELAAQPYELTVRELEPGLFGLERSPEVGIGQRTHLLRTPGGNLLWDPPGYLDERVAGRVRDLGGLAAIAASHPHMFGVQVEWSRLLGGPQVLVAEQDLRWVARQDPVIRSWSGTVEVLPGVTLSQPGGHFPGSAVAHWADGAAGKGVLLSGDTIFANPDRESVAFMRSFPNHIPLSAAVVDRVARHVEHYDFDRLYGNFDKAIDHDAKAIVRRSADRHIAWVNGDHDDLT